MNTPTLNDAKEKIRIADIAAKYYPGWKPGKSCRSPFRDDKSPSFSVFNDGRQWHDFATGETGDAIDFFRIAADLNPAAAIREFISMAGTGYIPPYRPPQRKAATKPLNRIELPDGLHHGTAAELAALGYLRNLSRDALRIACKRDLLFFCNMPDGMEAVPVWLITDPARYAAQARRLDGRPWQHSDGTPKAKTCYGSTAAWPVGIREAAPFPIIALTEGGPDFLAAFHFALAEGVEGQVAPVAMLGGTNSIHESALPCFRGKRVRIFPHIDETGREAAERWECQLKDAGAVVDCFNLEGTRRDDGSPIGDLNDLSHVHPDDFEDDRALWSVMPEGGQ
jgi:hypothetical protein